MKLFYEVKKTGEEVLNETDELLDKCTEGLQICLDHGVQYF